MIVVEDAQVTSDTGFLFSPQSGSAR